jgi:hypothetical protein
MAVIIEFGENFVSIIKTGMRFGKPVMQGHALQMCDEAQWGDAVSTVISAVDLSDEPVSIIIPPSWVLFRSFNLPSLSRNCLSSML